MNVCRIMAHTHKDEGSEFARLHLYLKKKWKELKARPTQHFPLWSAFFWLLWNRWCLSIFGGQSSRHLCRTCTKGTPFIMDASSIYQTLRHFCRGQCIPIQCDVEIPIRKLCCADFWSSFGCERALLHSSSSQWTHLMYLNIASLTM